MKRLYHLLALLAFANLFAVAGLVTYLLSSGRLNAERADQIAKVLRGEWPEAQAPASQPAPPPAPPEASRAEIARVQAQKEFHELIADRHKREMEDRLGLNQSIRLQVMRDLEQLETRREDFKKEKELFLQETAQLGFEKELELFSKMDPVLAKDLLASRKDADVVQLLSRMDTNRAKKIIDACKKSQADKTWIGRIVEQIPKLDLN
jgi:hypothetical protein